MGKEKEYDADSIKILEGLEGVKKRPSMYIGSTGKDGLHHLVYEIVDNSVDEALAGYCNNINIVLNKDGSVTVLDDGRGIPVEINKQYKRSALEIVFTKLHAGGKFDKDTYKISGGLHGVGASVVNALSEKLTVQVKRDGKLYEQQYKRGAVQGEVKVVGKCKEGENGTIVTFYPDPEIFSTLVFDFAVLKKRLQEIAFLNAGLKITLQDDKTGKKEEFYYAGGLIEFIQYIVHNKGPLHKPIYFKKTSETTVVEVALQYTESYNENIFGFVNTINTTEGGTHISGFKSALTGVINDYAKKKGLLKNVDIQGDDTREGVHAIISLKLADPQFEGQTKTKLGNSEVKGLVDSMATSALSEFFEENPTIANKIVQKVVSAAKARDAAKKARDLVRRKSALGFSGLPGKLADCSSKKFEKTELYIVEGDSAAGCFHGDTKIALADGRNLSFKDLVEEDRLGKKNYCYTIKDDGTIGIEKIESPRITKKNTEVIKIVLDNHHEIVCTLDHKFMLKNRTYKKAKDLTEEDSLMPLYEKEINAKPRANHRIINLIKLKERIDVYDIEVPNTHNFALSSGVFVHNSSKMARDKEFQAILPLKGKILNVEKANPVKAFAFEGIINLITAIGTGVKENYLQDKLRYNKIILMCDADVDGQHITTLLLTFFFRYMPQLIESGNVYVAVAPLYRIRKGKDVYVYSDAELEKKLKELGGKADVQRFKGLGEMNPAQLWDTTMNPKTRILKRVNVEDAVEADKTFSMLMGDEVGPRREFIQKNAHIAEIDI